MFTSVARHIPKLIAGISSQENTLKEAVISIGLKKGIKPSIGQCLQVIVLLVGIGPPEFNCKRICDVNAERKKWRPIRCQL